MQGICANFSSFFSIIDIEITKTVICFLNVWDNCLHNYSFICNIALDISQIFLIFILVFFNNLTDIDSSSWIASSTVFFIALIFFGGIGLCLSLTYISKRKIVEFSFVFLLMLAIGFVFVFIYLVAYIFLGTRNRFFFIPKSG